MERINYRAYAIKQSQSFGKRGCDIKRKPNGAIAGWNVIREQVYDKCNHRCAICGDDENLEIHHIVPVHDGGQTEVDNLTLLCHECHQLVHKGVLKLKEW